MTMKTRRSAAEKKLEPSKGARVNAKHNRPPTVKDHSVSSVGGDIKNKKKQKGWNTMSHLQLKRFADDDPSLTAGARRDRVKHPHVAVAELDPSGRAACKHCGDLIPKGAVRLGLWLECHKGYRNLCTLHETCCWKYPETRKLENVEEIALHDDLSLAQKDEIRNQFKQFVETSRQETATS